LLLPLVPGFRPFVMNPRQQSVSGSPIKRTGW
jgi:hypothetical protein